MEQRVVELSQLQAVKDWWRPVNDEPRAGGTLELTPLPARQLVDALSGLRPEEKT
jgi:hypothetical protein